MKSFLLRFLIVSSVLGGGASAFSLYDTSPVVGLPPAHAARYYVSTTVGYDTNPRGVTNKSLRKSGEYVTLSASTDFADTESVDKLSYRLQLGVTRYFGQAPSTEQYYGDCGAFVNYVHAFSAQSRYTSSLHMTYRPEPSYADGMSNAGYTGDTLSWNWGNTYSQAIDARWSWNAGLSYSGTHYTTSTQSYDNRQYLAPSLGLHYRESDLTTYTLNLLEREEWRKEGDNSRSYFVTAGIERSLDPVSSLSASAGVQFKYMDDESTQLPTFSAGYRRSVTDGLSINMYANYSDENTSNYNSSYQFSYASCPTVRVGMVSTYVLSPDVSFNVGMQYRYSEYRKARRAGMRDYKTESYNPSLSMNYKFTQKVVGRIGCEFTRYTTKQYRKTEYDRWKFYTGLTYRF